MPELPEVETVSQGLAKVLVGKKISGFDCDTPKMLNYPLKKYAAIIRSLEVVAVKRRAKMIILELTSDWRILIHLKMTGQLVFRGKGECLIGGHTIDKSCEQLPNKFTHATFTFSDRSRLYFNDIRKFGWLRLHRQEELEKLFVKMALGPEPLTREFTPGKFAKSLLRRPKSKIKQFIMDARNVVGIGNIYADEVCFFSARGTTFSNYVNSNGEAGSYAKKLKVYQRYGRKCLRCGGEIKRQKVGGRTSSYCPTCQK